MKLLSLCCAVVLAAGCGYTKKAPEYPRIEFERCAMTVPADGVWYTVSMKCDPKIGATEFQSIAVDPHGVSVPQQVPIPSTAPQFEGNICNERPYLCAVPQNPEAAKEPKP